MKKLILAALTLVCLSTSATAFAAPPVCSASDAKGTVCWSNTSPSVLQTSCGGGVYVSGRVTNAGTLDDSCFQASQGPGTKVVAPIKQEKTEAK